MAVTRINNNQISDASAGNAAAGINAGTKVQDYSITAGKLANSLTYGSDLTITGNLQVQGNTTQIDTDIITVEDPLLVLASNQTGAPALDIGFIGQRGTSENIAFVWEESANAFITAFTTTTESNTTITVTSLADFKTHNANVTNNLDVVGTTSLVGNIISSANITGNLTAANLYTPGEISATGLVTGGNISTAGNVTSANLNVGPVTVYNNGNIGGILNLTANANITTTANVSANAIYTDHFFYANGTPISTASVGNVNEVQLSDGNGGFLATTTFTYNPTSNVLTAGNVATGGTVSATGNVTGGNVNTTGLVNAGNIESLGYVSAVGTVTGGNLITAGVANASAVTVTAIANTSVIFANALGGLSADATFTYNYAAGASLLSAANISATGTVTQQHSVVNDISNTQIVFGNTTSGLIGNNTFTFSQFDGQLSVPIVSASGNVSTSHLFTTDANVTGIANIGNVQVTGTANVIGNIDGTYINLQNNANVVGNLTAGNVSTAGNVTGANIDGIINTANINSIGALAITTANAITINAASGTSNVSFSGSVLNQVATPVNPTDAANKDYVDAVASGLDLKASCVLASFRALDTIPEVTNVVYNNGTLGVGATLTITTTSQLGIDGISLASLDPNARILIKNEDDPATTDSDAAWNGIYTLTSTSALSTVLTRSTDTDDEGTTGALPGAFTFIQDGTVNADTGWVCTTNNPIVMGTTPITWAQFSGAGAYTAGAGLDLTGGVFSAAVDNVTISINGSGAHGQISVPSGATFTNPNLGNALFASLTANTSAGNGNISANNISITVDLSATGTITGGNITTAGQVSTGNASVTSLANIGVVYANSTGYLVSDAPNFNYVPATTTLSAPNFDANGNISGANVRVTSLGNTQVVFANATGGLVNDTLFTYDIATGNLGAPNVTATYNLAAANASVTSLGNTGVVYANATGGLVSSTDFVYDPVGSGNLTVTGNVAGGNLTTGGIVSATGNIIGANVTTAGLISATGNIDGGNIRTAGLISATGNVDAGNVTSTGNISTTGNIIAAYFWGDGSNITGLSTSASNIANGTSNVEILVANGNVTFGVNGTNNVLVVSDTYTTAAGNLSAVGNVLGNNVSANTVTGTTSGTFGSITIQGPSIQSSVPLLIVNPANAASDFAVNGTAANVLYVNATTNTVSIGSNVQTTDAVLALNATSSFLVPVGNTAQRPATGVTGMQRFNVSTGYLEIFDGVSWKVVGGEPTVINDQQFNGDGVTTVFTLGSDQTTNSCLVSINGVVQVPTIAYSVVGTTLTFTEAPAIGDHIDVREIATTQTVTGISNVSGNAVVSVNDASPNVNVTGGLVVGNGTGFLYGDGTYLTNVGGGNVTATKIIQGTSQANFAGAGGSFYVTVAGGNIINATTGNIAITGDLNPSANATYNLGSATNQWNALYVKGTTIYIGDGTITSNASGVTLTNMDGGSFTVGGNAAGAGNITGGNVLVSGAISTTGTVTGLLVSSTGNVTAAGNVNAVSISATGIITAGTNFVGNGNTLSNIQGANVSGAVSSATTAGTVTTAAQGNITSVGILSSLSVSGAVTAGSVAGNGNTLSNIQGANVSGAVSSATTAGTVTTAAQGNITSVGTLSSLSVTGAVTVNSGITNGGANGSGNIGSSSNYFNNVFATATTALYADLAEKYTADAEYEPGTVVAFGGSAEVTASSADSDRRVAGVVSTNPSYIMNGGLEGVVATVALTGRVPTKVTGTVRKGDLMVSNGDGTARAEANPAVGSVIGKALADFDGTTGTIEVVVGRV